MVLYFPYSQFSSRFGDNIFTFRIQDYTHEGADYACGGRFTTYIIQVERGRSKWTVKRRYNDFVVMRSRLLQDGGSSAPVPAAEASSDVDSPFSAAIPELPPKTCFRNFDDVFIRERKEGLVAFLHGALLSASRRGVLGSSEGHWLLEFLGFHAGP